MTTKYNEVIKNLNNYMFNLSKLTHVKQHNINNSSIKVSTKSDDINKTLIQDQNRRERTSDIFFPKERDMLFWCYFIMVNGMNKYNILDTSLFNVEKNEKIKLVELIRIHKKTLISKKIRGIDAIENNLIHDRVIDLKTFMALCVISNLNVLFIHRRKIFKILYDYDENDENDENEPFIIHQYDGNPRVRYGYEINANKEKVNEYLDKINTTYIDAVNIINPLRAISSYKVNELRELAINLKIFNNETIKKKTKQHIYETIIQSL